MKLDSVVVLVHPPARLPPRAAISRRLRTSAAGHAAIVKGGPGSGAARGGKSQAPGLHEGTHTGLQGLSHSPPYHQQVPCRHHIMHHQYNEAGHACDVISMMPPRGGVPAGRGGCKPSRLAHQRAFQEGRTLMETMAVTAAAGQARPPPPSPRRFLRGDEPTQHDADRAQRHPRSQLTHQVPDSAGGCTRARGNERLELRPVGEPQARSGCCTGASTRRAVAWRGLSEVAGPSAIVHRP